MPRLKDWKNQQGLDWTWTMCIEFGCRSCAWWVGTRETQNIRRTSWVTELRQRGRKSFVTGNKKELNQNWIGLMQCERWEGHIPGWGWQKGGDTYRAVSREPACLLRLKATLPCPFPVPVGVKLIGLGMTPLRNVIYTLAFPFPQWQYLFEM